MIAAPIALTAICVFVIVIAVDQLFQFGLFDGPKNKCVKRMRRYRKIKDTDDSYQTDSDTLELIVEPIPSKKERFRRINSHFATTQIEVQDAPHVFDIEEIENSQYAYLGGKFVNFITGHKVEKGSKLFDDLYRKNVKYGL